MQETKTVKLTGEELEIELDRMIDEGATITSVVRTGPHVEVSTLDISEGRSGYKAAYLIIWTEPED